MAPATNVLIPTMKWNGNDCTPVEFLDKVAEHWPSSNAEPLSRDLIDNVEYSLRSFPHSARLWCIVGDLMQIGLESTPLAESPDECYKKAILADPIAGDGYEGFGLLREVLDEAPEIGPLLVAERCDSSLESYLAIIRILHAEGEHTEARSWIERAKSIFERALSRIKDVETLCSTVE